jgi:hypothetical protein
MILEGVWSVSRFEYARYIRWRPFWRWLVTLIWLMTGVTVLLLGLVALPLPPRLASILPEVVFKILLVLPGAVAYLFAVSLTRQIFSDHTRRGVVTDIFMTALHPLEIVFGRLLAVGIFTVLAMLATAPLHIAAGTLVGIPPFWLLLTFLLQWLTALLCASVAARFMFRTFPEQEPTSPEELLPSQQRDGGAGRLMLTPMIAIFFYLLIYQSGGLLVSSWQLSLHLPLLGLLPFFVPLEIGAPYLLGVWTLPPWLVLMFTALGGIALMASATAQPLGWWSESGYRFQRWVGAMFLLAFTGLNVGVLATNSVPHVFTAEATVFWCMALCMPLVRWAWVNVLGYYGVALRPRPLKYALPVPLGGIVWEWGLLWGVSMVIWLAVGLSSGCWMAPTRWLVTTFYLWCLLVMLQALSARSFLRQLRLPTFTYARRIQLDSSGLEFAPLLSLAIPLLYAGFALMVIMPRTVLSHILLDIVLPLLPLGALSSPYYPLWRYGVYGLYALGVAGVLVLRAYQRERASPPDRAAPDEVWGASGGSSERKV